MAITPDTIVQHNLGDVKLTVATFVAQEATSGETWVGPKSACAYWWNGTGDNDYDVQISGYVPATGVFTFTAGTTQTGRLMVLSYDY